MAGENVNIGDTIRTKKLSHIGKVEKIIPSRYGYTEVYFRGDNGRLFKAPLENVEVIDKLTDGSMGGINQSHPATDVSYEKVLDDSTINRRSIIDEIDTIDPKLPSLRAIKTDPADIKRQRDAEEEARKQFSHILVNKEGPNVAHMIGTENQCREYQLKHGIRNSTTIEPFCENINGIYKEVKEKWKIYETDLSKYTVNAADAVKPRRETKSLDYYGFTIKYRKETKHKYLWSVLEKDKIIGNGEAYDEQSAIDLAQDFIKKRAAKGDGRKFTTNVNINFNIGFSNEFFPDGGKFYAMVFPYHNGPILVLSTEPRPELKPSGVRISSEAVNFYSISITAKEAEAAGVVPHGRYILGDREKVENDTYLFPLIFQSIAASSTDRERLGYPGLIIANTRN